MDNFFRGLIGRLGLGVITKVTESSSDSIPASPSASNPDNSSSSSARPRFFGDGDGEVGADAGEENTSSSVSFTERKIVSVSETPALARGFSGEGKGVGGTEPSLCVA